MDAFIAVFKASFWIGLVILIMIALGVIVA